MKTRSQSNRLLEQQQQPHNPAMAQHQQPMDERLDLLTTGLNQLRDTLQTLVDNNGVTHEEVVATNNRIGNLAGMEVQRHQAVQQIGNRVQQQAAVSSLLPKSFAGSPSEDVNKFLRQVNNYAQYAQMDEEAKLRFFPLILSGRASIWFEDLPQDIKQNWENLTARFTEQFGPNLLGFLRQESLTNRTQGKTEGVESYSIDLMHRLNLANIEDPERYRIFLRGLRPGLKALLLDKDIHTYSQAENFARRAESIMALQKQDRDADSAPQQEAPSTQATSTRARLPTRSSVQPMEEQQEYSSDPQPMESNEHIENRFRGISKAMARQRNQLQDLFAAINKISAQPAVGPRDVPRSPRYQPGQYQQQRPSQGSYRPQNVISSNYRPKLSVPSHIRCFNCNGNHFARDCTHNNAQQSKRNNHLN
jgi:hypothetical protein